MKFKKIKLVTKTKVDKNLYHAQLIPKQAEIIGKTCYMGLSFDLIYYLIIEYFKNNDKWFYDNSKYREIAFSFNYNSIKKTDKLLETKYLKRNNFFSHYYNFDDLNNLDILSGYENIVIGDIFKDFNINNIDSLKHIDSIMNKLISYGCRIYYLAPVYIFNGDKVYNVDSLADNESNLAIVAKHIFLDNYFSYLRKYKKLPIYRIVIPNYINYYNYDFMVYKDDVSTISKNNNKMPNNPLYINNFPFCFSHQLAEGLYNISINANSRNYIINSSYSCCLMDLTKEYPVYDTTRQKLVEFKDDIKINSYDTLQYKKMLKEIFNRWKDDNINYSDTIVDNENKYSFKELDYVHN
jgi:hypothetical protein